MMSRINPSALEAVVLSLWLGAAALFTVSVAPAAFAVLPNRTLAGAIVGRVLPAVFYAAMIVGVVVGLLEVTARDASLVRGRGLAAVIVVVTSGIAQFIVGSRIERIRAAIPGPIEALSSDDARRVAFGRLHAVSVGLLGLAMIAAFVAVVLAVRSIQSLEVTNGT